MRSVRYRVGGPPDEHCAIHVVETAADLTRWAYWVAERSDQVLGLDCETNALDPHQHRFRTRTVQTADEHETWVVPVWESPAGYVGGWIGDVVRKHPRWIAHFAENDERFLCRGMGLDWDPVRWDEAEPHFWDSQTVLAVYDPRTVTTHSKQKEARIHPAIPRPRALKPTVTRLLTPSLAAAEDALNARFRELAPKGYRGGGPKTRAWGFANVPIDDPAFLLYAALDPLCTVRIYHLMRRELEARGQWARTEAALAEQWMVDCATAKGMRVDEPYARWLRGELERVCAEQRPVLDPYGIGRSGMGGNVAKAFHSLGVTSPTKGDADDAESWDRAALELTLQLGAQWLTDYAQGRKDEDPATLERVSRVVKLADAVAVTRKADKYRSTWVEQMIWTCEHADGAMHPSMRAVGTGTTRMSCGATATAGPLHSAPKREETRLRACVRAERGWAYVSADLRQGEPFTMAALSGDPDYLRDLQAGDVNSTLAARLYPDYVPAHGKDPSHPSFARRQACKFAWLAACYGAADRKVDALLGLPGSGVLDQWRSQYPVFWAYSDQLNWETAIRLDSGHRVPLWDRFWVDERDELRLRTDEHGSPRPSRLGLNAATQGTQADVLAVAMHRLRHWGWTWACRFFLHDEIVGCVPAWMADHFARVLEAAMTVTYRGVVIGAEAEVHGPTWMPQTGDFSRDEVTVIDEEMAA